MKDKAQVQEKGDLQQDVGIEDTALVRRCQRGDVDAAGRLILKYQDRLYNAILKICQNRDDAAELTQDTFVKVLENIGGFAGRSGFYTWLFRIGINLTLNYRKRRLKLPMRSLDNESSFGGEGRASPASFVSDCGRNDPALAAASKESIQLVLQALKNLEQDHRVVLVLREIEQMSYQEIAEVLCVEPGTVKSRLSRARAVLKDHLQAVLL